MSTLYIIQFSLIYHKKKAKIQDYTWANECGEQAQNELIRLINIGLPQSMRVYVYKEKDGAYTELCNRM